MLATQSIILNHPNILFHRYSTTVCFETYLPEVLGYAVKTKSDEQMEICRFDNDFKKIPYHPKNHRSNTAQEHPYFSFVYR